MKIGDRVKVKNQDIYNTTNDSTFDKYNKLYREFKGIE